MIRYRTIGVVAGASLLLAAAGMAREFTRFGWTHQTAARRLEQELTRRVSDRERQLEAAAQRVTRVPDLVAAAETAREQLPELFARLEPPAESEENISTTVWVPKGPAGGYRILAWSEGPAEEITPELFGKAPAVAVLRGASGLRLVHAAPILINGRRLAVAAAEAVIAPPIDSSIFPPVFGMSSSVGTLVAMPLSERDGDVNEPEMVIPDRNGAPLLRVALDENQIERARHELRWRAAAVAFIPWILWITVEVVRRAQRRTGTRVFWRWLSASIALAAVVAATSAMAIWLARRAQVSEVWVDAAQALTALILVALLPAGAWWTRVRRASPSRQPYLWGLEQLFGGAAIAAGLSLMAWLWQGRVDPTSLQKWQLPIQASDVTSVAGLAGLLLAQIAIAWAVAGILGVLAARWRLGWRRPVAWMSALLWAAPAFALPYISRQSTSLLGAAVVALAAVVFGLTANAIRRQYRATSEARRLVLRFGALLLPVLAVHPLAASSADRTARSIIERDYGPATVGARRPEALLEELKSARAEVDQISGLPALLILPPGEPVSSQSAFSVWTQTVLSRHRLTSEVKLYGVDNRLTSRFSLNMPEVGSLYETGELVWQGTGCTWKTSAEPQPSGPEKDWMLHAERGVCSPSGAFLGAIVLHIIPDYRALPFVSSANPYYDVLGGRDLLQQGNRIAEIQLVVYGWGLQPLFTSSRIAWPIDAELDRQLTRSREPFWRDRDAGDRTFHIYFQNDRIGIYALGYPSPSALQHVTRLAEAAALLVGLFIAYLTLAAVFGRVVQHTRTALPRLFREIRASFYRKLFLFFVLAAVGPVVLFAIAFGSYMSAKLRADVESEAGNVVVVARRVFDELSVAQTRGSQSRLGPSDAMMVWIRQVMDQDINLYEGPLLTATSQRDLFNSGLLPTRTPAAVYRQVVLERRPISVTDDRFGTFKYLVAAVPVRSPVLGRDAVLSVPLATRQREIEREIDDLSRGVLAGTVVLVLFAAVLGASVAARVSDPVARLTRATRLIAAGRLDERLVADSADELGRLVEDFNTMTDTLVAQRAELARANQLKAWAEMSRQVAHEVKNPLTPIQLAAEHLHRIHEDHQRPLGAAFDQCVTTILKQVRLLRKIASEFSTFASQPTPRIESVPVADVVESVVAAYRPGLPPQITMELASLGDVPPVRGDRTLLARALTNLVENALQAMPAGGLLRISAFQSSGSVVLEVADTGVGMGADGVRRAFEPYFSTKTGGSGLGLANAKRNIELCGGSIAIASAQGSGTTVTVTLAAAAPAASDSA